MHRLGHVGSVVLVGSHYVWSSLCLSFCHHVLVLLMLPALQALEAGQESSRPREGSQGPRGTVLCIQAHLDPQTQLGTHRAEVQWCGSCGSCGLQLSSRERRAHNPCSPHFPDLKERPLFPLNVLVKPFLKNSNLISVELRERNVWSPLPGRLRGSLGEGDSLHSGWTLCCAHSCQEHGPPTCASSSGREVPCYPVLQMQGLRWRRRLTPQVTGCGAGTSTQACCFHEGRAR